MTGSHQRLSARLRWCDDTLARMGTDSTLSDWLRQALRDLARRDPLDALYDCEMLTALMRDRADQTLRKAGAPIGPNADSPGPLSPANLMSDRSDS